MSGDVQRRLAEALRKLPLTPALPLGERGEAARLLAPLVDDLCRERAAAELRAATTYLHARAEYATHRHEDYAATALYNAEDELRDRAAALDPEETP